MTSGLAGFLIVVGLIVAGISLWLLVLWINFLRFGRKAFDLYLRQNDPRVPPVRIDRDQR